MQSVGNQVTNDVHVVVDCAVPGRKHGVRYNDSSRKGLCFID
jgi:hypothetical protein